MRIYLLWSNRLYRIIVSCCCKWSELELNDFANACSATCVQHVQGCMYISYTDLNVYILPLTARTGQLFIHWTTLQGGVTLLPTSGVATSG